MKVSKPKIILGLSVVVVLSAAYFLISHKVAKDINNFYFKKRATKGMSCKFLVESVIEITNRGPFLVGNIKEGELKVGMSEPTSGLAVRSVDYVDHADRQKASIALGFTQPLTKEKLIDMFPVNTSLLFYE